MSGQANEPEDTPVSVAIEKIKKVEVQSLGASINVDRLYKVTLRGPGQGEEVHFEANMKTALARASGWLIRWAHPGELKP